MISRIRIMQSSMFESNVKINTITRAKGVRSNLVKYILDFCNMSVACEMLVIWGWFTCNFRYKTLNVSFDICSSFSLLQMFCKLVTAKHCDISLKSIEFSKQMIEIQHQWFFFISIWSSRTPRNSLELHEVRKLKFWNSQLKNVEFPCWNLRIVEFFILKMKTRFLTKI